LALAIPILALALLEAASMERCWALAALAVSADAPPLTTPVTAASPSQQSPSLAVGFCAPWATLLFFENLQRPEGLRRKHFQQLQQRFSFPSSTAGRPHSAEQQPLNLSSSPSSPSGRPRQQQQQLTLQTFSFRPFPLRLSCSVLDVA